MWNKGAVIPPLALVTVKRSVVEVDLLLAGKRAGNRAGSRTNGCAGENRAADNGRPDRADRGTDAAALKRPATPVRTTRRKGKRGNTQKDFGRYAHDCSSSVVFFGRLSNIGRAQPKKQENRVTFCSSALF
jgi:hypothetical protein